MIFCFAINIVKRNDVSLVVRVCFGFRLPFILARVRACLRCSFSCKVYTRLVKKHTGVRGRTLGGARREQAPWKIVKIAIIRTFTYVFKDRRSISVILFPIGKNT